MQDEQQDRKPEPAFRHSVRSSSRSPESRAARGARVSLGAGTQVAYDPPKSKNWKATVPQQRNEVRDVRSAALVRTAQRPPSRPGSPARRQTAESASPGLKRWHAKKAGCRERVKGVLDAATGVRFTSMTARCPPDCAEAHSGQGAAPYVVLRGRGACLTRVTSRGIIQGIRLQGLGCGVAFPWPDRWVDSLARSGRSPAAGAEYELREITAASRSACGARSCDGSVTCDLTGRCPVW